MKYNIPRNVKSGQNFMGLSLKGWMCLFFTLPLFVGLGWAVFKFADNGFIGFLLGGSFTGVFYYLYMTDERTGAMNIAFIQEIAMWLFSKKVHLYWEDQDHEKFQTLTIQVDLKKREE